MSEKSAIRVFGARQHNLQGIDVTIPRGSLTVITGMSGSGKSSLAFDTIFAEGQRKYVESLSAYARQFLQQMQKPDVDRIDGLSPTIAIEQRSGGAGPRSTVATTTEIHDYLRVLFARAGDPRCWLCNAPIVQQTTAQIVDAVLASPEGQRLLVLAPMISAQRGKHAKLIERIIKDGYVRARVDGEITLLEDIKPLNASKKHDIDVVVDRLTVKPEMKQRLADSVELATRLSRGRVVIAADAGDGKWIDQPYSAALACPEHANVRLDNLSPQLFSFNSPQGACETCHGLGTSLDFDVELVVPDPNLSLNDGAIAAWRKQGRKLNTVYVETVKDFCERFNVLPDAPFRNLKKNKTNILLNGTTEETEKEFSASFEGVIPNLKRRWETTESEAAKQRLHSFLSESPCEKCKGVRLNQQSLCVKIGDHNIAELSHMTIAHARTFFDQLNFDGEKASVAEPLVSELRRRLGFLCDVGVDYLALDRGSTTLSGGEFQRIRLAAQIGSQLAGVCYVLDEPTIGLHPRDTRRLREILERLTKLENTVIVVEHDEEIIAGATYMIDIGPGAGASGGKLVAQGTPDEVLRCEESVTARFLTGKSSVIVPETRRDIDPQNAISLQGVSANNLKNIDLSIPLGCLVAITGVSGSGKSTLIHQVLHRALKRAIDGSGPKPSPFEKLTGTSNIDKVIEVDQSPIGRTPRSNPATYVGVFNLIRELFAQTREAKIRGYGPPRFSFNIKGGRCELCEGQGVKRIAMHFLPDVFVTCAECNGARYNRETLEIRYRGESIADVLNMPIERATRFFDNFAKITRRLQALEDVGLGYMTLGQASSTLSGGEAQRVKLAAELHRAADTRTLYLLDEPTTGLHFADVRNLLTLLGRLVDRGQTVVAIEHNLDVIKCADWVIDLGPEGGEAGGEIIVEGRPEEVALCERSHTGRYLRPRLAGTPLIKTPS